MTSSVRSQWPHVRLFALVAVAYAVGCQLSWHSWKFAGSNFAEGAPASWQWFGAAVGFAFFPPAGVTVAAMLLTTRARWPIIAAAVVVAELAVDAGNGVSPLMSAGLALANVVEPLVGASVVRAWCGGPPDLRQRRDLGRFLIGACLLGPLLGGVVGAVVGVAHGGIWWASAVLRWCAGDGLGVLVVGLPILLWPRQSQLVRSRPLETTLMLTVVAALSAAAFWVRTPPAVLLLPALAWAAFRLEVIGAALAALVLALVANYMTAAGHGAVATLDVPIPVRLAIMQVYIAVLVIVVVLVGQEAAGRVTAVRQQRIERRERSRLQSVAVLAEQLAAALTPVEIGKAVAAQVLHDTGAQAMSLRLLTANGRSLKRVHSAGYAAPLTDAFEEVLELDQAVPATDAVRASAPVLIQTRADCQQRYPQAARSMIAAGAASMGAWPLVIGGNSTGAMELMWTEPQPLDAAQQAYAAAVANLVAQALPRARRYSDEHARSVVLQAAILPVDLAEIAGLEVAVCYEPADAAHGLGGDWYDAMVLPDSRAYLAVGDVVGHGLAAVEDMAQLRAAGRTLAVQGKAPAELLAELSGVTRHICQGKFATMTVAIFDPATGSFTYGSAGHPPALLRRSGSNTAMQLADTHGVVLGPVREPRYTQSEVTVRPGDIVVMYTDGLVERRGEDIEVGINEAQGHIASWRPGVSLPSTCKSLIAAMAPPPREDDVCILALRRR